MQNYNLIFLSVPYPEGMAATKRIKCLIEEIKKYESITIKVLSLRSYLRCSRFPLSGIYDGIEYSVTGHDISLRAKDLLKVVTYYLRSFSFLLSRKKHGSINILYVPVSPNLENIFFILFAKVIGYKIVIDIYEDDLFNHDYKHIFSRIKKISSVKLFNMLWFIADGIFVISNHLFDKVNRMTKGKIPLCLLPISVNIKRFNLATCKNESNCINVFYGGSFDPKDGIEYLITAFEKVCCYRDNLFLQLTGHGAKRHIDPVLKRIEKSKYSKKIIWWGYLSDEDHYNLLMNSDILCMTRIDSKFANAGFPFKVGEYLATGNPVVSTNIGDIGIYLRDKESAIIVKPNSAHSIAEGIKYLIDNNSKAKEIGSEGRKVAEAYFCSNKIADRFIDFIESCSKNDCN